MPSTSKDIKTIHAQSTSELRALLGENPLGFLENLRQPTWITLAGEDQSRSRAIITLLHANEPSGLKALHQFLRGDETPKTNLGVFIGSVEAALYPPAFSHRYLPDEQDLNRCFGRQDTTNQHLLANKLIEILKAFRPEAVVDTHNTSGHSEVFAVATTNDLPTHQVTQLFTQRLVYLDQSLGTLIEQKIGCPIVTVEFGGFLDPNADQLARASLEQFICQEHLFSKTAEELQVLVSPKRLQVTPTTALHYATTAEANFDVTIFNTIDQLNFQRLSAGTHIGWASEQKAHFLVRSSDNSGGENQSQESRFNLANQYFESENGIVKTKVAMTIFMATTDAQIAKSDCLLYFCPEEF